MKHRYQNFLQALSGVISSGQSLWAVLFWILITTPVLKADCNDPLTGKGVVVDELSGICLLCDNPDLENLLDGDLSNFVTFTAPVTVLGATPVVSIKDVNVDYAAGERVGYVIEPVGGLLSASVLGGFQIRTFLNNVLQETVTGSALTVQEQGSLRRISFVTTQAYDEVELRIVSVLGVLSSIRVYYAFGEPASGCDYGCVNAIAPPGYASTINNPETGIFGLCILCSLTNRTRVVDGDTTNFANISLPIGVGGNARIAVDANEVIPANYEVGFAMRQGSGLLNLTLLGAITISTYKAGVFRESVVADAALANVTLLGATDINLVSFKTTLDFDEVRMRVDGISILVDLDVFYAFVRPDDDNDGFTNCVDKCPGEPDFLDADSDGIPDGCDDPICMLNAGLDISVCPPSADAQLVAAGIGQTWSALPGNPSAASISASGTVTGMDSEGTYGFVLSEGTCHDTVYIDRFTSTLDAACNNPITGPNVIITDPGDPDCLLCLDADVVIGGVLSAFVSLDVSTSIIGATTLVAVKDTSQVYPAGRRVGFVVQSVGGLLDATLLGNLQIRTYLNGVLQETATVSGNVLGATALTGDGALQRLSFITTLDFDEVELVATATLNLLTEFRVYYAFEEPGTGCPTLDGETCTEALNVSNSTFCGQISYERTGIVGVACVACGVDNLGNLIDGDSDNFATIQLTVGVGTSGQVSVYTRQVIPAGYTAGYVISGPVNLLDANVLSGLRVVTFLNGVEQEEYLASAGLLQVQVLDASSGRGLLSFVTSEDFDEVQLRVDGLVAALGTVQVYYAFARRDSDGDGSPDCADKCCGGDDNIDTNGNGVPDACDPLPVAVNDMATTDEDTPVNILVLANDDFGGDGPGMPALQIVASPSNGMVVIDDNGTPADPTDDFVVYTPAADYFGADVFSYRICDSNGDCDTATVNITVNPANDLPEANDDVFIMDEDGGATNIPVLANDDFGGDGPSNSAITIITPPTNGVAIVNDNGTPNDPTDDFLVYTPNADYNGPDQITYEMCDADGNCDQATVSITVNAVNDLPVVDNEFITTPEDSPVSGDLTDAGDSDPDGTVLTANIVPIDGPDHGTITIDPDGSYTYTPDANYVGNDTVVVEICDAGIPLPPLCANDTIFLTITPVNDPPVAANDTVSTPEGLSVDIPVLDNDLDIDSDLDTSSIVIITPPGNGTAIPDLMMGTIEYTPDNLFFGSDTFSYAVCDLDVPALCDTAIIIVSVSATNARLALKMRLQGALYGSPDTLMRDDLRTSNRIPKTEPYTALSPDFEHVNGGGGEMVTDSLTVFANYGSNSIVDWVFVELRDSVNLGLVVATRAALLQRDGDVVDVDGKSLLMFTDALPAKYAVAIRHRNHLGTMTELPVLITPTGTVIDFTNVSTPLYDDGTNLNGLEQITIDGKFALWAGNVNKNKSVVFAGQNNDKDPIFNQVDQAPANLFNSQTYIFNGYHLGDVNLAGSAIFAGQNNDVDPIFNNVDGHPRNILGSQTFIIREQLAQQ
jgi:VCBS repeat-containing protein